MENLITDIRDWFAALWHYVTGPVGTDSPDDGEWDD